jgi:phospholipase/lecithinase/hemolysin
MPNYSAVYSFGDSLADAGNAWLLTNTDLVNLVGQGKEPLSPPYASATYATGLTADIFSNGYTSIQDLSATLGFGFSAPSGVDVPVSTLRSVADAELGSTAGAAFVAGLKAAYGTSNGSVTLAHGVPGGTDFAIGGAVTGFTPENGVTSQLTDLNTQLATYQNTVGSVSPTALYTVTIGSNDLLDLLEDPNYGTYSQAQIDDTINASAYNEISFIGTLIADGAKHILVQNVPNLGATPEIRDNYPFETAAARQDARLYDQDLHNLLGTISSGATITVENLFKLIKDAVAHPKAFDLTNVRSPVYAGSIGEDNGTVVSTDPQVQNQYLFFDSLHPTETGQSVSAYYAARDLTHGIGVV